MGFVCLTMICLGLAWLWPLLSPSFPTLCDLSMSMGDKSGSISEMIFWTIVFVSSSDPPSLMPATRIKLLRPYNFWKGKRLPNFAQPMVKSWWKIKTTESMKQTQWMPWQKSYNY
jgi:hypothetical protein